MFASNLTIRFEELPDTLPIFPLSGALLLPRGQLPLNIFEPRYLNMINDALSEHRLIGMIQPDGHYNGRGERSLYKTGCAGRVTSFMETDDGRMLITLTGIIRFDIGEEIETTRGYRRIKPAWARFRSDYHEQEHQPLERELLTKTLQDFFAHHQIEVDWQVFEQMPSGLLVNFLAMNLPFEPQDKQALLEAVTTEERARMIQALAEMALATHTAQQVTKH